MRTHTRLGLLTCCCAALAACTAAPPKGPDATVTTPVVGRPPEPASAQAALSGEPFSSYAALGQSSNDGLAPGESRYALIGPCLNAAGYPGVTGPDSIVPFGISIGGSLAYTQPWGGWGYVGAADAQQYGFQVQAGAALSALGFAGTLPTQPPSVPAAERAAGGKCGTIIQDFANAAQSGALAGINTLVNDIANDVQHDPAVKAATRAWSACMAKNGYSFDQPQNVFSQELQAMHGGVVNGPVNGSLVSSAANQAQIATAVTDADCTQSTDLAGIYFAVQASYEQQLVTANQQALSAAVSQYRAAYQKELTKLAALLRTAKALPFVRAPQPARRNGHTG
jgi:hypothetical protein